MTSDAFWSSVLGGVLVLIGQVTTHGLEFKRRRVEALAQRHQKRATWLDEAISAIEEAIELDQRAADLQNQAERCGSERDDLNRRIVANAATWVESPPESVARRDYEGIHESLRRCIDRLEKLEALMFDAGLEKRKLLTTAVRTVRTYGLPLESSKVPSCQALVQLGLKATITAKSVRLTDRRDVCRSLEEFCEALTVFAQQERLLAASVNFWGVPKHAWVRATNDLRALELLWKDRMPSLA